MKPSHHLTFGPFCLDVTHGRLWRGEQPIVLRPRSLAVLQYLVEHPGRLVTKAELRRQVWAGTHVTDIVLHSEELERLATTDGMTGIYNRRHFMTLADHAWSRSRRYNRPLSFPIIDIDYLKSINDRFGHDVGDQMIVHLTPLARACKRDSDVLARIGGEEFALLLPETTLAHAELMAERLRRQMAENPLVAKSDRIPATVSIGVAVADETMAGIADLMKAADHALYNAKDGGRNRVISGNTRSPLVPAHLS